jgi:hypothetical protein
MNDENLQGSITGIKGIQSYLAAHGWRFSTTSIYRHISEGKLRSCKDGVFETDAIDLYAKRHLKPVNVLARNYRDVETVYYESGEGDTSNTFADIKGVRAYLSSRGWTVTHTTLYRHVNERKLKRSQDGRFHIMPIEKYARKNLKCLDVMNPSSEIVARHCQDAMNIFLHSITAKIIRFVSGDISKIEELKSFIADEAKLYFKFQYEQKKGENGNG